EAAHRALIRIHAHRGHENVALRQFELCRTVLKKQLDAEPEAQTSSLAASLLSRERTGRTGVAAPVQVLAVPTRHDDQPSIAVLPFQNLSGDVEQEYFADGMVEDIVTALAHFRHLFVVARNSSFAYKGRSIDIKQVGRELGVRYVVEGSVRRAGDRLRIAGQLIDTTTGAYLWADRFDGTLAELFDLQDQVASSIVGAITPKVEEAEIERAKRKPTESLDAYDYYLRGLAAFDRTITSRSGIDDALRLFMKAIDLDPEFAIAHARAARCYATRKSNGWMVDRAEEIAEATRLARRAVELGRDDAIALSYGGYVLGYVGGDLDASAACIDRALALNPNLAAALGVSSWVRACLGEPGKAVEHAALAMRLSPLDPRLFAWQFNSGLAHFCAGHYDDAVAWAGKSLRHQPNYVSAMRVVAAGHALAGRLSEAQQMMARVCEFDPSLRLSNLAEVLPPFYRP
ncbi:MAG: adenylate cyclase, partial [Mesorhizobium sp.]